MNTPEDTDTAERTPEADLALIRSMMLAGRQRMGVDGIHLVLWGTLLTLAFAAQYMSALEIVLPKTILGIWVPVYAIGFVASYLIGRKNPRPCMDNNLTLKIYATAWNATGISVGIYFFFSMAAQTFNPMVITILTTACFGSAFFVNSVITGLQKLKFVALGWWALMAFFTVSESTTNAGVEILLILSAACFFLLLIPGYLLRRMLSDEE